ncbi:hypothetical protein Tco_0036308, partial [Tanacetum coccineum]
LAAAQPYSDNYYQAPKPRRSNATSSSTRPSASTRHKGKEIAKPVTYQSESVSEEDSDPEQAQRDKDMQNNLALLAKNKTEDTTPRYNNDNQSWQFGNQRIIIVAGTRETVGSPVVQQMGYSALTARDLATMQRNAGSQSVLKTTPDTDEEIDEQELEAHYSFMVQNNDENSVFANERQHSENKIAECADERAALANLIANLTLDTEENKMILKQLKKANASLTQETRKTDPNRT